MTRVGRIGADQKGEIMSQERNGLMGSAGADLSRREMLRRLGYGVAGAALSPSVMTGAPRMARQKGNRAWAPLSDFTPVPLWEYNVPASYELLSSPIFYRGALIISARDDSKQVGILYSIDSQTQVVRWSHSYPGTFYQAPSIQDGLLYAASGDGVSAIDPATGNVLWQRSYNVVGNLTLAGGMILFVTAEGHIVALDFQGNQLWLYQTYMPIDGGTPSVTVADGNVLANVVNSIYSLDQGTGSIHWGKTYDLGATVSGDLAVSGGNVYYTASDSNLYAVAIANGGQLWKWQGQTGPNNLSSPVSYNGVVYLSDTGGRFHAIQADTGAHLWQIGVQGGGPGLPILIEDGIAYFTAITNSAGTNYAVELASRGTQVVSYSPDFAAYIVAVETGVCYLAEEGGESTGLRLHAVDMAGLFHQFFAESELIVEDYATVTHPVTGAQTARGKNTSFRTQVQLFDPNKNPRANKSVKVWASGPVTITSGGQTYQVDTQASAWLTTDTAGELSLVSMADTITAPALYLWGNFMEVNEAVVLYPDYDTLNRLSGLQANDLSPANARAYDGSALLPSHYTTQQTSDLAATIRNTIGGSQAALERTRLRHQSGAVKRRRARPGRPAVAGAAAYIAFPESTPNLLYQRTAGPTDRAYVPGAVKTWTANFDGAGGVTFTSGVAGAQPALPGGLFGDFDDFLNDVVNGLRTVGQIVWGELTTVYNDVQQAYRFEVVTLEQAVAVVVGALKTAVGDIQRAVEWLSYLFDWDDILATKDQLKNLAQGRLNDLKTWVDRQAVGGLHLVHGFFQTAETQVSAAFGQIQGTLGSRSLQSAQNDNNNPQAVYGAGGPKSYTKSRWLTSKFKDNAAQGKVGPSTTARLAADPDPMIAAVKELTAKIQGVIDNSPDLAKIPGDVKKVFADLSGLVTDPSAFVTNSFGDVLTLLGNVVVALLQLTDAVIELLLDALKAFVDAVIDLIQQPINIPVISDLYALITNGSAFSILDLACLLVAIPTAVVSKAVNSASRGAGAAPVLNQNIGYLFTYACYTVLDSLLDVFPSSPAPFAYVDLGLTVLLMGLNFPDDFANNTTTNYVFYALQIIPIVMAGIGIRASALGPGDAFRIIWEIRSAFLSLLYGVIMIGLAIHLAVYEGGSFRGKDYLAMIQNIFTFLPSLFKLLGLFSEDASQPRIALGIIDAASDLTALGLWEAQIIGQ